VKFALVDAEKASYRVTKICAWLEVSRSGYYAWKKRKPSARQRQDEALKVAVLTAHATGRGNYGSPRIHRELRDEHEIHTGIRRITRLRRDLQLKARIRRRYKHTTVSDHDQPISPNLLEQKFEATAPNQRWVGDTTELLVGEHGAKLYLAVIVDLFARFVVGWALSARNDRHLVMKAMDMAIRRRRPKQGLIFHSDQGSPYASEDHQNLLAAHGVISSMSRRGNCYDNAAMESWFSTYKAELGERFATDAEGKDKTFDYVECFYNTTRRHSALDYMSPARYERAAEQKRAA
jgi:transposase InsO family protein